MAKFRLFDFDWMERLGISDVPVSSKADKLSNTKQKKQLLAVARTLDISERELILFSAKRRRTKRRHGGAWPNMMILVIITDDLIQRPLR